ncbi:30S ribosomal protein S2 [Candidatus Woesebacteria bacterium]|nr:30S ribosomal protein S2 [Candidatus Woesebacteria bacterium]
MADETAQTPTFQAPEFDLRELLEAGCHFGHQKSKWNPHMAEWIYMEKDGVHIFDLEKTASQLQIAYTYAYELGKAGKSLVVVGTKKQAREVVREAAKASGVMYITSRWLGGLLTNWDQVKRSLERMLELEKGLKTGAYDGFTKYERTQLEKEEARLARFFEGIRDLKQKPDYLFIIDPKREKIALKEAVSEHVPVIAMVDSNTDPTDVTVPIPANDDALKSIEYIVTAVTKGYAAGKQAKK